MFHSKAEFIKVEKENKNRKKQFEKNTAYLLTVRASRQNRIYSRIRIIKFLSKYELATLCMHIERTEWGQRAHCSISWPFLVVVVAAKTSTVVCNLHPLCENQTQNWFQSYIRTQSCEGEASEKFPQVWLQFNPRAFMLDEISSDWFRFCVRNKNSIKLFTYRWL